ncbi:hypothetical protein BGX31_005002, partial [Mortierella sp. GBA43]
VQDFSVFEDNRGIAYHTIPIDENKTFVQSYYPNQLGAKIKVLKDILKIILSYMIIMIMIIILLFIVLLLMM